MRRSTTAMFNNRPVDLFLSSIKKEYAVKIISRNTHMSTSTTLVRSSCNREA
ncbi:MAG TPA: hypothetical protein VKM55_16685 [Candidatus Lokiarchaeia archaeon]|nr:hypothetical protein [Candidatus Lokiarchaeia archaeon]